jgi:Tfp pilus assembly protein PilV
MRAQGRHRGFSLVEAAIASTVLAVIVVSALNAAGRLAQARYDEADRGRARALADALVAEIRPKAYTDPQGSTTVLGPDANEGPTRVNYDDVDDYNGDNESPPVDVDGVAVPSFAGWSRSASVEWVRYVAGDVTTSATDRGILRVTVVVKHGDKEMARRVFLRTSAMDSAR